MKYWRFCQGEACVTLIPRYPSRTKYCTSCAIQINRKKTRKSEFSKREAKYLLRTWNREITLIPEDWKI